MRARTLTYLIVAVLISIGSQAIAREFSSPWLRSQHIPQECQETIWKRVDKYEKVGVDSYLRQMHDQMPYVEDATTAFGTKPWWQIGTSLAESKANRYAVDGVFKAKRSIDAHCGVGQFNCDRLPIEQRDNPDRIHYAKLYQKTGSSSYLKKWVSLDDRFSAKWSQYKLAKEGLGHLKRTGDSSFIPLCHNAGGGAVVYAIRLYFEDVYGFRPSRSEVPSYVQKYGVTAWDLFLEQGRAYQYLMNRGESLGMRMFTDAAWSELYARWCVRNHIPIEDTEEYSELPVGHIVPVNQKHVDRFILGAKKEITLEHKWYTGSSDIFKTAADLKNSAADEELIPVPKCFSASLFKVDSNVGQLHPCNMRYYQMASPKVWGMLSELDAIIKEKSGDRKLPKYRITSLARSVDYIAYGSKKTSHNYGSAVDFGLKGLSESDRKLLLNSLYILSHRHSRHGRIMTFYLEGASPAVKGHRSFRLPHSVAAAGQIHVVVNPKVELQIAVKPRETKGKMEMTSSLIARLGFNPFSLESWGHAMRLWSNNGMAFGHVTLQLAAVFALVGLVQLLLLVISFLIGKENPIFRFPVKWTLYLVYGVVWLMEKLAKAFCWIFSSERVSRLIAWTDKYMVSEAEKAAKKAEGQPDGEEKIVEVKPHFRRLGLKRGGGKHAPANA